MDAAPAVASGANGANGATPILQSPDQPAGRLRLPEVFLLVADLQLALGVQNLPSLPGCWKHRIDEHWTVAINAHDEPVRCEGESVGFPCPPHSMYFEFHGWPAGLLNTDGGTIAAGEAANEETLIEALRVAVERAKEAGR